MKSSGLSGDKVKTATNMSTNAKPSNFLFKVRGVASSKVPGWLTLIRKTTRSAIVHQPERNINNIIA